MTHHLRPVRVVALLALTAPLFPLLAHGQSTGGPARGEPTTASEIETHAPKRDLAAEPAANLPKIADYRSRLESDEQLPPALSQLIASEPAPQQVLQRVERFLRLHTDDLGRIRSRARARSAAPLMAVGGRLTQVDATRDSAQRPSPVLIDENTDTREMSVNVGVLWDLRDAAFNGAEIDVYSVTDLRRRILTEASRIYLARRLMQIDLHLENLSLRRRLQIEARIADYTASLDALTGGWFSEAVQSRNAQH